MRPNIDKKDWCTTLLIRCECCSQDHELELYYDIKDKECWVEFYYPHRSLWSLFKTWWQHRRDWAYMGAYNLSKLDMEAIRDFFEDVLSKISETELGRDKMSADNETGRGSQRTPLC